MTRWAIVTGEYPPQPGGVSDYTRLIASALAHAGDRVDVYAPSYKEQSSATTFAADGVRIHRLPGCFGPRGLAALDRLLNQSPPDRALIQYVPHAFGMKAMNLLFTRWVRTRLSRRTPVWVMFHEVAFPETRRPLRHAVLGKANRRMARDLAGCAERIFVSIPAWESTVREICPTVRSVEWLPIPCVLPTRHDPNGVPEIRRRYAASDYTLLGHFGTYASHITTILQPTLTTVLDGESSLSVLLMGRGSTQFAERLTAERPDLAVRIHAAGELADEDVAPHLAACDLLLQPFADGISSRRSSIMHALANAVPVVTNLGALSESIWQAGGVAAAAAPQPQAIAVKCAELIADQELCRRIGREGLELYRTKFALEHTIEKLRGVA